MNTVTIQTQIDPTPRDMLRALWLIGAFMMVVDSLTTWIALTQLSSTAYEAREANPAFLVMFESLGIGWSMILKALIGILCLWRAAVIADRGHTNPRWDFNIFLMRKINPRQVKRGAAISLTFGVVITTLICGNNIHATMLMAQG